MNAQTAKITPGPWAHRNGRIFAADRENLTIAHVARAADGDYSPANGDLIAAAPDLLEALRDLVTATYHMRDDATSTNANRFPDAHAKARAAIAKATGEQP